MDSDGRDKKLSVPHICHEFDGELNIFENELFQRRKLPNTESENQNIYAYGCSCSFRNRPHPKLLKVDNAKSRRNSLPSPSPNFLSVSFEHLREQEKIAEQPLQRVRSFKTTTKGRIINRGDSFKRSSASVNSTGSAIHSDLCQTNGLAQNKQKVDSVVSSTQSRDSGAAESTHSALETAMYRVAMLGDKGVGKSSLTKQFMTSEFVAFENDQVEDITHRLVTVLLNSEEYTLEFVERTMNNQGNINQSFDAFVVVFSKTDRTSYQTAVDYLYSIRHEQSINTPTILIANKIDLVRKRKVSKEVFSHEDARYWDMENSTLLDQDLYRSLDDDSLFLDEQLTIKLHITEVSRKPSGEEQTVEQTPTNKQFTYAQTKCLISFMQNQLVEDGDDPPKCIQKLNNGVYMGKGKKKNMWQEVSNKLSEEFKKNILMGVSRKLQTLVDGYKKRYRQQQFKWRGNNTVSVLNRAGCLD